MADDAGRLNQVFAETSFLYGANAAYIEELHEKWAGDPASVSGEWRAFFDQLRDNAASVKANAEAGAWGRSTATEPTEQTAVFDGRWPAPKPDAKSAKPASAPSAPAASGVTAEDVRAAAHDSIRALMLIRSYRVRGHLQSKLDPLGIEQPVEKVRAPRQLVRQRRRMAEQRREQGGERRACLQQAEDVHRARQPLQQPVEPYQRRGGIGRLGHRADQGWQHRLQRVARGGAA